MVIYTPKEILVEFLRARITDPNSRHTTTSDTFSGDGSTTDFTLTPTSGHSVQAINSVTVGGSTNSKWEDYYIDLQNQQVIFKSAPTSGTDNITVSYEEGTTSWIYPDKPRADLSSSSLPRISVLIVDSGGYRAGKYDAAVEYKVRFQIDIWTKENDIETINGRKYEGDRLAQVLGEQVCNVIQEHEDDLHPIMYDYDPITGPRDMPYDVEHQCFHSIVEVGLKMLNIGDNI